MNIDNSLINSHSFLTETHPLEAKEVKNGVSASEAQPILPGLLAAIFNSLGVKSLSEALSEPELKAPSIDKSGSALKGIADDIEYKKINENAFSALYASLLALFAQLNEASGKLTGMHATIAEKLAKSSGDKMIQGAVAQKNQAIAMAATTMGVSGVGLAYSQKGISKQQSALKQSSESKELNTVNNSLNASITNGTNLRKTDAVAEQCDVFGTHINYNKTKLEANDLEVELKKMVGQKKQNTGSTVSGMSQGAGHIVSSGYSVEAATENAGSQMDATAKDTMLESEVKNRDNQNAARNSLKQLLDLIYQSLEKNNEATSHIAQMLKV